MAHRLEANAEGKPPVRLELKIGEPVVIGRAADAGWPFPSDAYLSRRHVEVVLEDGRISVKRLPGSTNAVYHGGVEATEFFMGPGEFFAVGKTRFSFLGDVEMITDLETSTATPAAELTMNRNEVYSMEGRGDRLMLLDLLELPELLRAREGRDFQQHVAGLLRMATGARWACVATEDGKVLGHDAEGEVGAPPSLSRSVIRKAMETAPAPTYYSWAQAGTDLSATVAEGVDWAICAAAKIPNQPAMVFYAAGGGTASGDTQARQASTRFVGLVADMVGRTIALDQAQAVEGRLERYFSKAVAAKIAKTNDATEMLPRVAESTIMFFDIRGFSKKTEQGAARILEYLGELRRVMSAMTQIILDENGAVLQYMGDGIMACWNVPFEDPDHVSKAVRAAMRMAAEIGRITDGWRCGIGLHSGEVVAGSLGSDQVFQYGVMGAVVNQSSRVEGITKAVETPILITGEVADKVSRDVAVPLRIGRFQPAGMTVAIDLFEPTAPPGDPKRIEAYSAGLAEFEKGNWEAAYQHLDVLPPKDLPARFLKSLCDSHRRHPPKHWQGIIELTQK